MSEPIDPKVRAVLDKIQRDLSMTLKPFRFELNTEEARANISKAICAQLMEAYGQGGFMDLIPKSPFEVIVGDFDEKEQKFTVTLRGPRELLERLDLGHLRRVDDYRLRAELPDGTLWEAP